MDEVHLAQAQEETFWDLWMSRINILASAMIAFFFGYVLLQVQGGETAPEFDDDRTKLMASLRQDKKEAGRKKEKKKEEKKEGKSNDEQQEHYLEWSVHDSKLDGSGVSYNFHGHDVDVENVDPDFREALEKQFDEMPEGPYGVQAAMGTRQDWIHWGCLLSKHWKHTSQVPDEYQNDVSKHIKTLDQLGQEMQQGYQGSRGYVQALHCIFQDTFVRCHLPSPPRLNLEQAIAIRDDGVEYKSRMRSFNGHKFRALEIVELIIDHPNLGEEEDTSSSLPDIVPLARWHRKEFSFQFQSTLAKWEALKRQDPLPEAFFGEEYEAPNEFFFYQKMFDRAGRYFTNLFQELAQDPSNFNPTFGQALRPPDLQIHPGADSLLLDADRPLQPGWYDIVFYCTAGSDYYRNGRSNGGLMKVEQDNGDNGIVSGELRPTAQSFLSNYCGLHFQIQEGKVRGTFKFNAPDRFAPGMQHQISAKVRVLQKDLAVGLDLEGKGGHKNYGTHFSREKADRVVAEAPANGPCPAWRFQVGDILINTFWKFMEDQSSEVCFVVRKRQ